jgi:hypothetical protein
MAWRAACFSALEKIGGWQRKSRGRAEEGQRKSRGKVSYECLYCFSSSSLHTHWNVPFPVRE